LLPLYGWFDRDLLLADARTRPFRQVLTTRLLDDRVSREQVLALLRAADLGITGIKRHALDPVLKERLQRALRILSGQEGDAEGKDDGPSFDELNVHLTHQGASGDVALYPDEKPRRWVPRPLQARFPVTQGPLD